MDPSVTDSKTSGAPTPLTTFSQGVAKGGFLSVSGQGPQDPESGAYLHPDDLTSQTVRTLDNVKAIVEAAGGTFEDIVSLRVFLTKRSDFAEMNAAYAEYLTTNVPSGDYPTRTTVMVELPNDAMLVEIDGLAILAH